MKRVSRILVLMLGLPGLCSCARYEKMQSSLIPEGEYQRAIGEFNTKEPVRTYLAIRDLLSDGSIEEASRLTTQPSQFIETMNKYKQRIGEQQFRENYSKTRDGLTLHSVHHDGDQSLLVLDTGKWKVASFFHRANDSTFLEIEVGGTIKVKPALNRKFYIAKGEPEAVLEE